MDAKSYVIVDRLGTQLLYDPLAKGTAMTPTGQGGWFAYARCGADVAVGSAVWFHTV